MRNGTFSKDAFYHVFHRGVEHRSIFEDEHDHARFYQSLYLLNDNKFSSQEMDSLSRRVFVKVQQDWPEEDKRERMVDILAYNLLGNHFHLLLRPLTDDSLSLFMKRLLISHARYFNIRHERTGTLFDGRFRSVEVRNEAHLYHLPCYIHLNSGDLFGIPWREEEVDVEVIRQVLEQHPWSSHSVYQGGEQDLPVVNQELVRELFPSPEEYTKLIEGWSRRTSSDDPYSNIGNWIHQ